MTPLLTFDAPTHTYTLTGSPVRSVTQILRKVGLVDFRSVPPTILEAARRRGTVVHQACHYYNEGDLDVGEFCSSFPDYAPYLRSWIALVETGRLQPFACEKMIASFAPRFAGTCDFVGTFDGEGVLLDFATGDPADAAKHLQTSAYVLALRAWSETPDESSLRTFLDAHPYITRYAVRLQPDGALPLLTPYRDPRDFSKFLTLAHAVAIVDDERPESIEWDWQDDEALRV